MFTKNRTDSSTEKINHVAQSLTTLTLSQRGSVLIWLIGAMVIMAVLGTGMLYLTTTSTYNQLFFGSHSDAYCAAESGGRYAMSVIRDAYAAKTSSTTSTLAAALNNKTFTLSNGNSFQIINLTTTTSNSTDTLTFSSIGMVGSGFMQAKRQMSYWIQPSNQGGYNLPVNYKNPDMTNFTTPTGWGTSAQQTTGGNTVLAVTNAVPESGGSSQEYRFYAYYSNPSLTFSQYQSAQGGTLGYDAQLKVNVTTDYFVAGLAFRTHALKAHYPATHSISTGSYANDPRGFNLTIMRTGGNATDEGIPLELVDNDSTWQGLLYSTSDIIDNYYIILWADTGMNGVNSSSAPQERLLAYKKLDPSSGVFTETVSFSDDMESGTSQWTASSPWGQITSDSHSTTHCWTDSPSGNYANNYNGSLTTTNSFSLPAGTKPVLTFWHKYNMASSDYGYVQISTDGGNTWPTTSTYLKRYTGTQSSWTPVSVDLSSYAGQSNVKIRFWLRTNASTQRDGWYIDDVKISSTSLTAWPTLLVRLEEKNTVDGDDSSRRNIIKAYYSTPTANPIGNTTTDHTNFYDDNRLGSNPVGTFKWPDSTNASDKNFTIVKWDWIRTDTFTTGCASPLVWDDSHTVLTTKYFLTKTSRAVVTTDPFENCGRFAVLDDINYDEVGLNVFGINADNNVYFDDLAINISNGAGANGTGQVIQYP